MQAALSAFEQAFTAGKTTPELRAAMGAYREVAETISRSIKCAVDDDERQTLEWILWCVELQAEARVRREMERT